MSPKGAQQAKDEDNLSLSLSKENAWADTYQFYLFENFWCPSIHFQVVNNFKKEFQAKDIDFVVASFPKSGYWEESIARPDKVLFLKYDDLKEDTNFHVKSVAKFLGCPFTQEEENNGVIENIIKLCSFEKMKDLEVNKSEIYGGGGIEKKNFFCKGENGDWVHYFSPSMTEKLSKIIEEKLSKSGLSFKMCS
ncbi:hypothetical protein LR48_Vigan02g262100 [Vigna angularis]|uniref:Sulfotransferase n=1 Tax=Phaseolus angularis TaxID=3914 RepID=A0A0L9U142_PHAAN|nr:hypothetical protein LR48_Vigan02g262100 [Vigna angularis]